MPRDIGTCVHESAHAICMLILETHITEVVINGRSGHCRGEPKDLPLPDIDSWAAIVKCATDFIGVTAMCRAFSLPPPESDADFARHGGTGDVTNFKRRAAVLTNFDERKTATLRARAIACARLIVDEYGRAIDAVADDLYINGALDHAGVVRAVRRVPDDAKYLLHEPPRRALKSVTHTIIYSFGSISERPNGSLLAINRAGRSFVTRSLGEAYAWL